MHAFDVMSEREHLEEVVHGPMQSDVGLDRTHTRPRLLDIEMASGLCQHGDVSAGE